MNDKGLANSAPALVYVGALFHGSTALHRWQAVRELTEGAKHVGVDTAPLFFGRGFKSPIWRWPARIAAKAGTFMDIRRVAERMIALAGDRACRLLWLDKTIYLAPEALRKVRQRNPGIRIVFYTPDDMANPSNKTEAFLTSLPIYDLVVTTKSFQVDELKAWGARDVMAVDNAYAPEAHYPEAPTHAELSRYSCDCCFVGGFESERATMLARLADEGIGVRVWSWDKGWLAFRRPNLVLTPHFVSDGQYRKAISGAKINVGFLRKVNRDLQTTRSVEIPACGGFLLAERTEEHNRLFAEGSEAEYFGDYDELINKVRRFLEDNSARRRISAAGYKRCLQGSYSNRERLAPIVARMFAATNQ